MIEEATTDEDYVYDVYDTKARLGAFSNWGERSTIGVVFAKSRREAYDKACKAFCKTGWFAHPKPPHIIVAIRAEVNYKPAERPLTARELREWQLQFLGISPEIDTILEERY